MGRLAPASGRLPSRLGARSPAVTMTVGRGVAADSVRWVAAAAVRWVEGRTGGWILGISGSPQAAARTPAPFDWFLLGHGGEAEGAAASEAGGSRGCAAGFDWFLLGHCNASAARFPQVVGAGPRGEPPPLPTVQWSRQGDRLIVRAVGRRLVLLLYNGAKVGGEMLFGGWWSRLAIWARHYAYEALETGGVFALIEVRVTFRPSLPFPMEWKSAGAHVIRCNPTELLRV